MTKEEKELLVKDLCGRLPYNVKVRHAHFNKNGDSADIVLNTYNAHKLLNGMGIYAIRPYLRPLSTITSEEISELKTFLDCKDADELGVYFEEGGTLEEYNSLVPYNLCGIVIDWLNARHFDHSGLIDRNLALEAPQGMYDIK